MNTEVRNRIDVKHLIRFILKVIHKAQNIVTILIKVNKNAFGKNIIIFGASNAFKFSIDRFVRLFHLVGFHKNQFFIFKGNALKKILKI